MKIFMVERDLSGISLDGLGEAKDTVNRVAARMRAGGTAVNYLRSTFVPGDGRCMCLFEADEAETVRRLNDEAGLPYDTIVDAYDLTPEAIRGT